MKKSILKQLQLANRLIAIMAITATTSYSSGVFAIQLPELLENSKVVDKVQDALLKLDVNFGVDLGNFDIIEGVNIANKYRYEVEPSYQDKYYTRIDKWDIKLGLNPGTIIQQYTDFPISFGISKGNSFYFVRQFQKKGNALKALPYTPYNLPVNAKKALKLHTGDFVSIPANLNLTIGASIGTTLLPEIPTPIGGSINGFFVLSGEYALQIFKLDEKRVRLKIIANQSLNLGSNGSLKANVNVAGFKLFADDAKFEVFGSTVGVGAEIDKELKKQSIKLIDKILEREFINYGVNYNPGASFIADYVFDLSDTQAALAYNQILSSTYKFKDVVVFSHLLDARQLKDKLITTTELADSLAERDRNLADDSARKVTRIFKGFTNYTATNRHIKLGIILATYQHNTSYVENKLTFIDKNDHSMEFFYPTFSRYFETNFGKLFFNLKDQSNKTYFGLIPKKDDENVDAKNPDFGMTFERKDKIFAKREQRKVAQFMLNQIPRKMIRQLKLDNWTTGTKKYDSRIYFQVILKSQGFQYLRSYTEEDFKNKLLVYLKEQKLPKDILNSKNKEEELKKLEKTSVTNSDDTIDDKEEDSEEFDYTLGINGLLKKGEVNTIASVLYHALHDEDIVSEKTLKKLLKLNEVPLFTSIGLGYLISLVPQEKLDELIYVKVEMLARDVEQIKAEFGELNYKPLYTEINTIQSRIGNRSYDLRLTDEDLKTEDTEVDLLAGQK